MSFKSLKSARVLTRHIGSAALAAAICVTAVSSPSFATSLAHRWSFNGNLNDSVGTAHAITKPAGTDAVFTSNNTAVRTGTDNSASSKATSLNLGTGLVTGNDATIEFWCSRVSLATNARLFDWGNGGEGANPSQYICVPWNDNAVIWIYGKTTSPTVSSCFVNNVRYHVAMTIKANGDGSSSFHFIRRNLDDPTDVKSCDHTINGWTLSSVTSGRLYLGHSQWPGESGIDANATYDEVRLWSGVVPNELLGFSATMDPDTLPISYDANGKANITIPANGTLAVNANTLGGTYTLDGSVTLGAGAKIVFDNANFPGGMTLTAEGGFNVPSGSITDYVTLTAPDGYAVNLQGNTISVVSAVATSWTGAAGDGSWANADNWSDGVPTANSDVTVLATATSMPLTTGACKSFTVAGGTLSADCDWSGIAVKPVIAGSVNINGHNLTMPSGGVTAQSGAAFTNSSQTDGEVRFYADGDPATVTEATFIDGIANLTTSAKAKIVIVRSNSAAAGGTLNIGAANNHTVFRAESGTISMSANGQVGMVNGGVGYLDITGGTVDFCTARDRGLQLGGAGARSFMTISGGKLQANWIDAGHNDVTECTIVQTGGEIEMGINNNGNIWLGRNARGKATYTLSGGSIYLRTGTLDVGNYGTGTFTQNGGDVSTGADDVRVGMNSGSTGTYTLNDGNLTPKYWLHVGRHGNGTFIQNGGNAIMTGATIVQGNWLCIGESETGSGRYVMNGGYLEAGTGAKGGGIFLGRAGNGRFDMNGGTVFTPAFVCQSGDSLVLLNGGTIKVSKDSGTGNTNQHTGEYAIFKDIGNLVFGYSPTKIDTDGHNTKIVGCGFSTINGGALTKMGAGTLTLDAMPPVEMLLVSNGVFKLSTSSANIDNAAPVALTHRWSFNGSTEADCLKDSLTPHSAKKIGSALSFANGEVVMSGDGNSTGSLNLGKFLMSHSDATIEIWATRTGVKKWARVFDIGSGTTDYFFMSWVNGTNGSKEQVILRKNGRDDTSNDTMLYADNVKYHISVTFKANGNGSTTVSWARRNVETGVVEKSSSKTYSSWTLANLIAGNFYLGHSQWSSDFDANAKYDEVRIWNGALTADALTLSAQKGPDASTADIAEIVAEQKTGDQMPYRFVGMYEDGVFDLGGNTLVQPGFFGVGTVRNGNVEVTQMIAPAGILGSVGKLTFNNVNMTMGADVQLQMHVGTTQGDLIEVNGTLDLTDTFLLIMDPENITAKTSATLVKCSTPITGMPSRVLCYDGTDFSDLPKGWGLEKVKGGKELRLHKSGMAIYIR